ncbi:unnamed protein product [Penicillium manginii]
MSQKVALVTGATGHQGGATARELLKSGVKVHALVRSPSSEPALELRRLGVHLFPGDFDNAAMEGVTAVFLNVSPIPSDAEREVIHGKNVIEATKNSGSVTTIVYSSVSMAGQHELFPGWGPDHPMAWYWLGKYYIEAMVRESGVKYWTILRPAFLMNNYHSPTSDFMFPDLAQRGVFLTAYKRSTAMTVLDPGDVGKFAAAAIAEPEAYNKHEIDLGVEALTPAEIVRELSRASGKEVGLQFYSDEEVAELAPKNPVLIAQLWTNDVGYQVDFKKLSKYPIRLTRFREYLEKHRDQVLWTFN